ncbi:hypothetical protein [[Mycoplasma] anseris]|uniref:Uncharacterized protein n=1 Tax=[Mycoplasma] anseris TaxID=92400 RepID=A0A2Z4NCZ2_9BACT|nr:hypothetical protein [[Mycoplasma] anseris]AWX69335.1 hypothetical protein DP065_01015 [[Mycoplasma] anseris]
MTNEIKISPTMSHLFIIPFEIGGTLVEKLSKNLLNDLNETTNFLNGINIKFTEELKNIQLINSFEWTNQDAFLDYEIKKTSLFEDTIAHAKITNEFYFLIQANGIGLFILFDKHNALLNKYNRDSNSLILKNFIVRHFAKSLFINDDYQNDKLFANEIEIMNKIKNICWDVYYSLNFKKKNLLPREKASSIHFGKNGFNYINSVLFTNNVATDQELLYITTSHKLKINESKLNNQILKDIEQDFLQSKKLLHNEKKDFKQFNYEFYYGKDELVIKTEKTINSINDIFESTEIYLTIQAQIKIISELFIIKSVLNNISKHFNFTLKMQKNIETTVEYYQSYIDNFINIHENIFYKKVLTKAVDNLEYKNYCNALLNEISAQKRITKTSVSPQQKIAKIYLNISLALIVFCAFSLAIYHVIAYNAHSLDNWWIIPVLLFICIASIIAIVIFNLRQKR